MKQVAAIEQRLPDNMKTRQLNNAGSLICALVLSFIVIFYLITDNFEMTENNHKRFCQTGLSNITEDLLCKKPFLFDKKYKNPCWRQADGKLSCLPYFIIIGQMKCGTTDLFNSIVRHPEVQHPVDKRGNSMKEIHFYDIYHFGRNTYGNKTREVPFKEYIEYFDKTAKRIDSGETGLITGEGTPGYFWRLYNWKYIPQNANKRIPSVLLPHLIRHLLPDVKLILILRDPIDRSQSQYFYEHKKVKYPKDEFNRAVQEGLKCIERCIVQQTELECIFNETFMLDNLPQVNFIMGGNYYPLLKEWLNIFPRQQLIIIRFEDYEKHKNVILNKVFNFLNISTLTKTEMRKFGILKKTIDNKGINERYFTMPNSTRQSLYSFYKQYNYSLLLNNFEFD